ncbi:MAG: anthranilate synthase component I [Proteobacteria bacterium]|nr:anthranilate synthase component I [Pseudomonadota bacterium]
MVRPDPESFRKLARSGRPVPLVREVLADLDTPVATFLKLDDGRTSFLFESAEGGKDWGRFSFIGLGARARFAARAGEVEIVRPDGTLERTPLPADRSLDPLDRLRELLAELAPVELDGLPRFAGGAVGYVGYDWVRYVERLPDSNPDTLGVADALFTVPETVLVHDRVRQRLSVIHNVEIEDPERADGAYARGCEQIEGIVAKLSQPVPARRAPADNGVSLDWQSNLTRESYCEIVQRCKQYIRAGDIFQVVPSQRLSAEASVEPFAIYRQLRVLNPSPYLFFLRCGDHSVIGSSPEVLVRLEDGETVLRPIAGTAARGDTPERDREIERRLLSDPKELAEHVMLVDLGRNDLGRVCETGSVHVDEFQVVERYSHIMHIVSNVRGRLRADRDAVDLLRATFPAGTLTGAPKVRAMQIIDEMEPERRGLYGGSVGYIDFHGNMDMCIAIRTLLAKGGRVYVQAGGGVVADSDPEREYRETLDKAGAALAAVERALGAES